jgi:hypothetical protein
MHVPAWSVTICKAAARSIGSAGEAVDGPAFAMTYWEIGIGCRPAKRGQER